MGLFNKKKNIIKTEIYETYDGLDDEDMQSNEIVGDMSNGFLGAVVASVYNDYNAGKTVFEVFYDDNSSELIETINGSSDYNYYLSFLN